MIPAHLAAPIDYEAFYSSADTDETQRFKALSVVLERLRLRRGDADWLSGAVHSVHLIDWDWRSESRKYNHRHVPMTILTSEILDWYREYGAFIQLDPERAQRFSFARFFFELAPRRDVVVVRFDLTGKQLFAITRSGTQRAAADESTDLGARFAPETVEIRLNRRHAMELCRPLGGLLAPFRERYPAAHRPGRKKIISLADTIGDLEEPVSQLMNGINAATAAREAYVRLPEHPLETLGEDANLLLHGP
ncbi:MAG: hypothetical protein KJ749_09045, partial [Planctomycetes bacterium]|nr:hypothetical protein [Planctomycetota bacterium]